MPFTLSHLPFAKNELAPLLSPETIEFHYERHHQTYVNNLNQLIFGTELAQKSLLDIVRTTDGAIFNNAAQIWNHDFYWHSLQKAASNQAQKLSPELTAAINATFGGIEKLKEAFNKTALGLFGSGWVWLVKDANSKNLALVATSNANTPITSKQIPLLTCDVWEHAYYIDYRNARAKYLAAFWQLVNWQFASQNFASAS